MSVLKGIVRKLAVFALSNCNRNSLSSILGTVTIGDKIISELKPLGGYHRIGLTKVGRLSMTGTCEGVRVKVYSCHSSQQAALRLAIQSFDFEGLNFPEIIAADSNLIAEAWIEGASLTAAKPKEREYAEAAVERFLVGNRQRADLLSLAKLHATSFCYFSDYLLKRLGEWLYLDDIGRFVSSWRADYDALNESPDSLPVYLTHPDLSAANLIMEHATGKLFIIDNELLGVGAGWILDGRNSLLKKDVLPLTCDLGFVEESWRLRRLGSALDANDFTAASHLVAVPR